MGKSRKLRRKEFSFAQKRRDKVQDGTVDDRPRVSYEDIVKENLDFENYYKSQRICPNEEWENFMRTVRESLPAAFRITGYKSQAKALLKIVQGEYFSSIINSASFDGLDSKIKEDMKPVCIPWYPDGLAWQLHLTRKDIRRSEAYVRLHNFLVSETECGSISRQEVVSMIPPLVLDVKPHHKVLDMCAAPGSKTAQLIELLHADEGKIPDGFVVANDVDNKRCYMLVHQAKRLSSPCFVITNHDSAVLPNFIVTDKGGEKVTLKFDRILCDVPCSGDGTIRKNPDVWAKWNAANGNNLHGFAIPNTHSLPIDVDEAARYLLEISAGVEYCLRIQYRIARRGAEMLAVGGRMVYSTCSFNPLEDEAVIHRLIVETEGALELVDVSASLPGLVYCKGKSSWIPTSRDMVGYSSFSEVPEKWLTQIRPTMFPPSPDKADEFHLDRCIRILPHHQDTGGFFVAVLLKTRSLPWEASAKIEKKGQAENETSSGNRSKSNESKGEPPRKKRRIHGFREDPFVFFKDDEPVWPEIKNYYGLEDLDPKLLLTRCREGKKKNIYLTNSAVRDIVINNEDKIKFINTGVKSFVRCDNRSMNCAFRIAQEGISSIFPLVGEKRKIAVKLGDLKTVLANDDAHRPPETILLHPGTQDSLHKLETGCCILVYKDEGAKGEEAGEPFSIELVGWKGRTSLRAYVPKGERVHYLRLCGGDVSKFEANKFKERELADAEAAKEENDGEVPEEAMEEGEKEDSCAKEEGEDEINDLNSDCDSLSLNENTGDAVSVDTGETKEDETKKDETKDD